MSTLEILGIISLTIVILLIGLIPIVATIVVGVTLANMLHFTGITWWSFVILFYLIIFAILGALSHR